MNYFIYHPDKDNYINRFITTGVFTRQETFHRVTLTGNMNEWLKYGFSIYENPCRNEFVEKRKKEKPDYLDLSRYSLTDQIEVFGQKHSPFVYFPFGNQGVDFSGFYYNPASLRSYHYVELFVEEPEQAKLQLMTCGAVCLWVNDQPSIDFMPFTRNMVKTQTVDVKLKQGMNKLIVCLDDLAERDTDYYFRIRYLGNQSIKMILPAGDGADIRGMEQMEQILSQISFDKECYISEPVNLEIENPCPDKINLEISYKPVVDKLSNRDCVEVTKHYELLPGDKKLNLLNAQEVIPGFYYFQVKAGIGEIRASRKIAVQMFDRHLLVHKKSSVKERKKEALCYLADYEVENVYKAAALLAMGRNPKKAEQIILEELEGIRRRMDCSDFHLIVVLQILYLYGECISDEVKHAANDVILGFRYWIDEPGDDVMWFFSENHALLFHICQYYAGKLFPDGTFSNSKVTGREQMKRGEQLLNQWFESFFNEYITEWNSNAYIPVDVLGLCGLYNLSEEEPGFREMAKKALDIIFRDLSLLCHKGAVMTTFGRSYEKECKGNYAAGTTSLLYIGYNKGCLNRAALAYISFALGDYEPPTCCRQYMELDETKSLVYEKTQGYEQYVNLYLYKDFWVQLSSAICYRPFTPGYQEHIMQATLDFTAQAFINHPGEVQPYGNGRPNYWAGNGSLPLAAQYRNLGILSYEIPAEHPVDFTHAYLPIMEFGSYIGTGDTVAAEKNGGYLGVKAMNGLEMQTDGPCRYREFISRGRKNVWIMMVGNKREYPSLTEFHRQLQNVEIKVSEKEKVYISCPAGQMVLTGKGLLVNGTDIYQYPLDYQGVIHMENSVFQSGVSNKLENQTN